MIREIVLFFFTVRKLLIKASFLVFALVTVLWISGGIYGSFYYAYIPTHTYLLPVKFAFDPCPMPEPKDRCSFLKASLDFQLEKSKSPHQNFSLSLELQLPSDDINKNVGMFMTCLKLETEKKDKRICQSAILPHRTTVFRALWSLWPFYNYGGEEYLSVEFFDSFQDDISSPIVRAHLEIQSRYLGVTKAWLRCHAHFQGLRYLMYHYYITSLIIGMTFISILIFSLLFLLIGKMLDPVKVTNFEAIDKRELVTRLEKCPAFGKLMDKIEKSK